MPDSDQKPGLRLTGPGALGSATVAGLVTGWSLRSVLGFWDITPPFVTVLQMLTLAAVGVLLFLEARSMRKHRHRPDRGLTASQAVNRLAMAKASAIVGAFVAAAYVGHAVSWMGADSEAAPERIARALIAALAGVSVAAGGLVLERACRAGREDD
jgi:hypothetical protein